LNTLLDIQIMNTSDYYEYIYENYDTFLEELVNYIDDLYEDYLSKYS
jgi:hypothetical protein